ncbi:MAG: hypothetical protein GY935_17695 [Gammaproteobacteria bacterium]|nr:hypothetical protein [Gammaproteobacteria bacterium]
MDTNKLVDKLEGFFDLSKKKQQKKHDKLLKIIDKLEEKKTRLQAEVITESVIDDTSERYQDLSRELNVISGLIKKAKKQDVPD